MSKSGNTSSHIDKSVIYVFILVFFLSLSVFAFKYTKYAPCENVVFTINDKQNTVGALIKFEDETINAESWTWDFGDNSIISTQKKPLHVYKEAGEYEVKLIVNEACEYTKTLTIVEKTKVIDSTKFPKFEIPKSIKVGQRLTVKDKTLNASQWEWRFGETSNANANTKNAKYTYTKPGLKTVSLIVNGDLKYITKKTIEVIPLKEVKKNKILEIPKAPTKKKPFIKEKPDDDKSNAIKSAPNTAKLTPYINDTDFSAKLMLVSKEKMSAKQFSEYFCGDLNKPIIVNGKNTTFLLFCEKISGKKRTKIKKIEIFRADKKSNCITNVTIDCRIPGLFND